MEEQRNFTIPNFGLVDGDERHDNAYVVPIFRRIIDNVWAPPMRRHGFVEVVKTYRWKREDKGRSSLPVCTVL
jgi:hypothetical protein